MWRLVSCQSHIGRARSRSVGRREARKRRAESAVSADRSRSVSKSRAPRDKSGVRDELVSRSYTLLRIDWQLLRMESIYSLSFSCLYLVPLQNNPAVVLQLQCLQGQGCSGAGTRGNAVPIDIFVWEQCSHRHFCTSGNGVPTPRVCMLTAILKIIPHPQAHDSCYT